MWFFKIILSIHYSHAYYLVYGEGTHRRVEAQLDGPAPDHPSRGGPPRERPSLGFQQLQAEVLELAAEEYSDSEVEVEVEESEAGEYSCSEVEAEKSGNISMFSIIHVRRPLMYAMPHVLILHLF